MLPLVPRRGINGERVPFYQAKLVERERGGKPRNFVVTFAGAMDVARFKESREIILRLFRSCDRTVSIHGGRESLDCHFRSCDSCGYIRRE